MTNPILKTALATLALLATSAVLASGVQLTNSVVRDIDEKGSDGQIVHKRVTANGAAPGDKVTYVLAFRNDDAKPIERVVVTNPVPANLDFVSVSGGGEVSVDGGKTYGSLSTLAVRSATGAPRSAQAADVTHVRWRIVNPIAPGAVGEATFEARVK